MRRGEDVSVPRRTPSWRGSGEGLERWPDSYCGSERLDLFGHPNTFGGQGRTT
jgi:hypothetical protein